MYLLFRTVAPTVQHLSLNLRLDLEKHPNFVWYAMQQSILAQHIFMVNIRLGKTTVLFCDCKIFNAFLPCVTNTAFSALQNLDLKLRLTLHVQFAFYHKNDKYCGRINQNVHKHCVCSLCGK